MNLIYQPLASVKEDELTPFLHPEAPVLQRMESFSVLAMLRDETLIEITSVGDLKVYGTPEGQYPTLPLSEYPKEQWPALLQGYLGRVRFLHRRHNPEGAPPLLKRLGRFQWRFPEQRTHLVVDANIILESVPRTGRASNLDLIRQYLSLDLSHKTTHVVEVDTETVTIDASLRSAQIQTRTRARIDLKATDLKAKHFFALTTGTKIRIENVDFEYRHRPSRGGGVLTWNGCRGKIAPRRPQSKHPYQWRWKATLTGGGCKRGSLEEVLSWAVRK